MFTKAVMESLKDLETGHPHVEEPSSHVGSNLPEPTHEQKYSFSTPAAALKTVPTSAATDSELILLSEAGINRPCGDISTCDRSTPEDNANIPKAYVAAVNNPKIVDATLCPNEAERNDAVSRGYNTPLRNQSSSDTDMADNTRVTVNVVKTPTTNIIGGLFRRWDLNFFKNR